MPTELEVYLDSGNAGPGQDDWTDTVAVRNHMLQKGFVLNETLWYYLDQGGQVRSRTRRRVLFTDRLPP